MDKNSVCKEHNFTLLFESHAEELRNFIYYRCGDLELAKDLTQEAYFQLWRNCKKVPFKNAQGYLFTVARNAFYSEVSHKKVVLNYTQRFKLMSNIETPEFKLEESEFMEQLLNAINALPNGEREVFLMNRIDGKTYKEMAAFLGLGQKAIEKRMHKALVKLRKIYKNI